MGRTLADHLSALFGQSQIGPAAVSGIGFTINQAHCFHLDQDLAQGGPVKPASGCQYLHGWRAEFRDLRQHPPNALVDPVLHENLVEVLHMLDEGHHDVMHRPVKNAKRLGRSGKGSLYLALALAAGSLAALQLFQIRQNTSPFAVIIGEFSRKYKTASRPG